MTTNEIRNFGTFSIFFTATFLVFWPYALVLAGSALGAPLLLIWQGDFFNNLIMFLEGYASPSSELSLVFLTPLALLFGAPILISYDAGTLSHHHKGFLSSIMDLTSTAYGFAGLVLTIAIAGGLVFWSLWCVRKIIGISWNKALLYLGTLIVIASFGLIAFTG